MKISLLITILKECIDDFTSNCSRENKPLLYRCYFFVRVSGTRPAGSTSKISTYVCDYNIADHHTTAVSIQFNSVDKLNTDDSNNVKILSK